MKKAICPVRVGAIVFHIAERHAGLLPDNSNARARAITWMFAALNTVEPPILDLATTKLLERDKPWYEQRLPVVEDRIRNRLRELSGRLGDSDWLDGAFSAARLQACFRRSIEGFHCDAADPLRKVSSRLNAVDAGKRPTP